MQCLICGHAPMRTGAESLPLVGLPRITLVGVEVSRCPKCGDYEVSIPAHRRLVQIVTKALLGKRGRLAPAELKWLRSVMGWTSLQLAQHVGVSAESVSKWENGHTQQSRPADRLVRMLLAHGLEPEQYPLAALPLVSSSRKEELSLRLSYASGRWRLEGDKPTEMIADPTVERWLVA